MSRLIRMDAHRHSTLAEWTAGTRPPSTPAVEEFRARSWTRATSARCRDGPGKATQVRELPREADLVIMRRPIAGG